MSIATAMAYFFFWLPVLALFLLSALLVRRRVYRELPFFFVYVTSAWMIGGLRFAALQMAKLYLYVYWISELAGAVLVSLALYEIFLRRLFGGFRKIRLYRGLFPAAALIILFLTIVTALHSHDKNASFHAASRAFDFARTATLVFFIALMAIMGRNWRRYDLGITLGFGLQAAAALAVAAIRTRLHDTPGALDTIEIVAYNLSCIIWLIAFLKPEPVTSLPFNEHVDPTILNEARSWEKALKNWLHSKKRVL